MKNRLKNILTLIIVIIGILIIVLINQLKIFSSLITAIISLVSTLLFRIAVEQMFGMLSKYQWEDDLKDLIKNHNITKKELIRISYAYLYKIKYKSQYLLIRAKRYDQNKYQPIGGAYKYHDEFNKYLNRLAIVPDDKFVPDETTLNDFRFKVPADELKRFYRYFNWGYELRENSSNILREFHEEILSLDYFTEDEKKKLSNIETKFVGRHIDRIQYSNPFQIYEMRLADIYSLELTKEQMEIILSKTKDNIDFLWADADEIKRRGFSGDSNNLNISITDHSEKIIDEFIINLFKTKNV